MAQSKFSSTSSNTPQHSLTILITGAGSGIGAALALSLSEQHHRVIVSDLDVTAAQLIAETICAKGYCAKALALDVSSQSSIEQAAGEAGGVDILINNAGLQHVAKLENFPPEKWRLLNEVMLVGPAMLTRALLPNMKANNFGRIINIGSIHALVASPFKSAYVAAKHGILGFSKVVALETAEFNITINTLCPSYVKTPLVEKQIAQQAQEHGLSQEQVVNTVMLEPMPKKSFIEMDELAGTVSYLISSAAKNITGQSIVLDGGWTVK